MKVVIMAFALLSFCCKREKTRVCIPVSVYAERLKGDWADCKYLFGKGITFFTSPIENHYFRFIGSDSFNLELTWFNDDASDSCYWSGNYSYIAGKYRIDDDRIFLKGNYYTDSSYTVEKNTGCDPVGNYDGEYLGNFCNDTLVLERLKPALLFLQYKFVKMYKK